jgi:23S rRNA (adenine2503-C2)-methyltransferase
MIENKRLIYDLDLEELQRMLSMWGEPAYRAKQVWQGLYQQLWATPEEFTSLPATLRQQLAEHFRFTSLHAETELHSSDQETTKVLFRLPDDRPIETVLMRYDERRTLCISSQAGCAMGCVFCATGQMGFKRHLTSGEIVEQVLFFARQLKAKNERVTNIVLMGMGEPLHNYDATLAAIDRLNDPQGFNLGERRFTISTVGLLPKIKQFADEKRQINLAISLHAATDELRSSMLPINRKYPISELMQASRDYVEKTGRRITFEWALIHDVNDSEDHARELARLLKGLLCHVNIIPLNPTKEFSGRATTRQRATAFRDILEKSGIPCTIRIRRGIDIQAGCGQLAAESGT